MSFVLATIGLDVVAVERTQELRDKEKSGFSASESNTIKEARRKYREAENREEQRPKFKENVDKFFNKAERKIEFVSSSDTVNEKLRQIQQASNNQFVAINLEMPQPPTIFGFYKLSILDRAPVFFNTPAEMSDFINQVAKENDGHLEIPAK